MSKQTVRVGNIAGDGLGDPLRTAMQKLNLNFTELYDFLAGVEGSTLLPQAIPISRGGTGGSSATEARANLGLSQAATMAVGDLEGNLLTIGEYGFGTDLSPSVLSTDPNAPADRKSGELGYLILEDLSFITFATREAGTKSQLAIRNTGPTPEVFVRGSKVGQFTQWFPVYTGANSIQTVNGNLKLATNSLKVYRNAAVSQVGTTHSFTRVDVGKYTVTDATLNTSYWTLEVPMDYKGNVQFEASVIQAGSAIEVTTTLGGVPYDIPENQWIDVHIL